MKAPFYAAVVVVGLAAAVARADPLRCTLSGYKPAAGLAAGVADDTLTITWDGERGDELRLRFIVDGGAPVIQELAVRKKGGAWAPLATRVMPDYRLVSGVRRMSNQQISPLRGLGVELTSAIVDTYRWEPFWDAPLDLSAPNGRGGNPPPADGVANQPGLPRKPDEIYASSPVTYVKLDALPKPEDPSPVIRALMRGDSFVTSGEVLIPAFAVKGSGRDRTIVADVEWTFPLNFVEVVWGDGAKSDRQVISTTDLAPMGSHHFEIPFGAAGRKWVRFAAWDCAGNGAMSQPIKLTRGEYGSGSRSRETTENAENVETARSSACSALIVVGG